MSELFKELIEGIFLELPVKSLLRFRCLSKTWLDFIGSEDFINSHLQKSINTNTNLHLILTSLKSNSSTYTVSFDDQVLDSNMPVTTLELNTHLTTTEPSFLTYKIMGSCNGLLLLAGESFLALWNPFSRRSKEITLPPKTLCFTMLHALHAVFPHSILRRYGFGYDNLNDDYKVASILEFFEDTSKCGKSLVQVYSRRTNSWKRVQDFPSKEFAIERERGSYSTNGALHWLVYPRVGQLYPLLVAFNLADEKFGVLALPNSIKGSESEAYVILEVLNGCLCICELCNGCAVLWVMKEYGVMESWFKLYSFVLEDVTWEPTHHEKPLICSKVGEKLLVQTNYKSFTWYDLKTKRSIKLSNFRDIMEDFSADMCFESLVSVGDDRKFDEIEETSEIPFLCVIKNNAKLI